MAGTTDLILQYLEGKTPVEIERTLKNLNIMTTARAEEAGVILARQQAADDAMSLEDVQERLQKAIAAGDIKAIERLQPLHKQKLQWVSDQVQADEVARVAKINEPAPPPLPARRDELIGELNVLTTSNVSQNIRRIHEINKELKELR